MTPIAVAVGAGAALVAAGALGALPRPRVRVAVDGSRAPRPPARWVPSVAIPRRALVAIGVLVVVGLTTFPPIGIAALAGPPVRRRLRRRRADRALARSLAAALPDAVDLLLLCAGAGLSLPLALPLVAERAPPPVGPALARAEEATAGGAARADALREQLGALGDAPAGLAHVLVDHLRYGVPLLPGLERSALELRLARRRRAEEEARRLPVRLLAPLLTCVLPAFVLLTVVPLLVAALGSLPR